eukprot:gene12804-15133_t
MSQRQASTCQCRSIVELIKENQIGVAVAKFGVLAREGYNIPISIFCEMQQLCRQRNNLTAADEVYDSYRMTLPQPMNLGMVSMMATHCVKNAQLNKAIALYEEVSDNWPQLDASSREGLLEVVLKCGAARAGTGDVQYSVLEHQAIMNSYYHQSRCNDVLQIFFGRVAEGLPLNHVIWRLVFLAADILDTLEPWQKLSALLLEQPPQWHHDERWHFALDIILGFGKCGAPSHALDFFRELPLKVASLRRTHLGVISSLWVNKMWEEAVSIARAGLHQGVLPGITLEQVEEVDGRGAEDQPANIADDRQGAERTGGVKGAKSFKTEERQLHAVSCSRPHSRVAIFVGQCKSSDSRCLEGSEGPYGNRELQRGRHIPSVRVSILDLFVKLRAPFCIDPTNEAMLSCNIVQLDSWLLSFTPSEDEELVILTICQTFHSDAACQLSEMEWRDPLAVTASNQPGPPIRSISPRARPAEPSTLLLVIAPECVFIFMLLPILFILTMSRKLSQIIFVYPAYTWTTTAICVLANIIPPVGFSLLFSLRAAPDKNIDRRIIPSE